MPTRVYGASDDLIEIEGGKAAGEVGCYGAGDDDKGVLLMCSDGTVLEVGYGKEDNGGIWWVKCLRKGSDFDRIEICTDEDADPHSDVAHFKKDLKWCYAAKGEWELVK